MNYVLKKNPQWRLIPNRHRKVEKAWTVEGMATSVRRHASRLSSAWGNQCLTAPRAGWRWTPWLCCETKSLCSSCRTCKPKAIKEARLGGLQESRTNCPTTVASLAAWEDEAGMELDVGAIRGAGRRARICARLAACWRCTTPSRLPLTIPPATPPLCRLDPPLA